MPVRLTAFLLVFWPLVAQAEGLEGRSVTIWVETEFEGEAPRTSNRETAVVEADVAEFLLYGLIGDGELFTVPVSIDLGARWITFEYVPQFPGEFVEAKFNGYVIDFDPGCAELKGARIDPSVTTLPLSAAHLAVTPSQLRIDVAGLAHAEGDAIRVLLDIGDCAMS